ncbi:MAG: SH3 domain-containing protein [Oscillospiraceae bacterium]|nr:SH3 domain-containing protein [Oscillospiraceae bacterium]
MSNRDLARRTALGVTFRGIDITDETRARIISLQYSDCDSGLTDDLQIVLQDEDNTIMGEWLNTELDNRAQRNMARQQQAATAGAGGMIYTVTARSGLRYRAGPGTNHAHLGTAPHGTRITVFSIENRWARVAFNGGTAFMYIGWLRATGETASGGSAAASGTPGGRIYTVTARSGLIYRAGPGTNHARLGAAPHGTRITVFEIQNGWARVLFNGGTAFMSASWLRATGEVIAGTPAADVEDDESGFAEKNANFSATIIRRNWRGDGLDDALDCGTFELDTVTMDGPPQTVTLKGTSLDFSSSARQVKRSRGWENITLQAIAERMARDAEFTLMFLSERNPLYTRREQIEQPDIEFLQSLCDAAGISLKITNGQFVLFDAAVYERADAIRRFVQGDGTYDRYRFTTGLAGTAYSAATVRYTTTAGETIEATFVQPGFAYDEDNVLIINEEVASHREALDLARRRLWAANRGETTGVFTMEGDVGMVAGRTIEAEDFGAYDGKYFIEQSTHTVDATNGYRTSIALRRVIEGYWDDTADGQQGGQTYTVVSGDSLWRIAQRFYGNGAQWRRIFDANRDVIEAEARRRGFANSNNGNRIWPGTVLVIP